MYGVTKRHKSPDESLKIATKHWALSLSVGIHHIGGGAAIAIATVIRLAYLERFVLNIGTLREYNSRLLYAGSVQKVKPSL